MIIQISTMKNGVIGYTVAESLDEAVHFLDLRSAGPDQKFALPDGQYWDSNRMHIVELLEVPGVMVSNAYQLTVAINNAPAQPVIPDPS